MEKKPRKGKRGPDWEVKIKGYEAAARPKSRSRKRHSPPSTSRSKVGEERRRTSIVHGKAKKERNYKEERAGEYTTRKTEMVEKSGGREKKIGREGGSRGEKSRKRGNWGWRANRAV